IQHHENILSGISHENLSGTFQVHDYLFNFMIQSNTDAGRLASTPLNFSPDHLITSIKFTSIV
ncbi:MAG: hypothetical protein QXX12_00795, partial [Nanopusillaceae archaeon]